MKAPPNLSWLVHLVHQHPWLDHTLIHHHGSTMTLACFLFTLATGTTHEIHNLFASLAGEC